MASTGTLTTGNPDINPQQAWVFEAAYERRFWDSAGLRFPTGVVYEDQEVSARAYARARRFDAERLDAVEAHVQDEEKNLLPKIESHASAAELWIRLTRPGRPGAAGWEHAGRPAESRS